MNYKQVQEKIERFNKAVEKAEQEGDIKRLWELEMAWKDSCVLRKGVRSGLWDEEEEF